MFHGKQQTAGEGAKSEKSKGVIRKGVFAW
jgi:hypothetical protein